MYTTPRIALAMFIMTFVGVVRGLWGSIERNKEHPKTQHTRKRIFSNGKFSAFSGVLRFQVLFVLL